MGKRKSPRNVGLIVTRRSVTSLAQDPANARKHNEKNLAAIKASLARFGQQKPIVVDSSGVVRAGNGTLAAALALGWAEIDCVETDLQGAEAIAYAIADNRTAELAEWDDPVLTATLQALEAEDASLLLDAGFDEKELAKLIAQNAGEVVEDEVPEPPAVPITQPGDLWLLGEHRLLCGDSTKAEDVARVMGGARAALCFTSPPYGQQRDYGVAKAGVQDWDGLMQGVFRNLPMADDGQVLVNLGLIHRENEWQPYWDGWIEWMREIGWRRFAWYVWDQGHGLMGDWSGRFAPSFEFVFHFNKVSQKPVKFVDVSEGSAKRADAKRAAAAAGKFVPGQRGKDGKVKGLSSLDKCGQATKLPDSVIRITREQARGLHTDVHPAVFPVALPGHFIKSWPGVCYEPFCGSGSQIVAAEQIGSECHAIELEPRYCDVAVFRWEKLTGKKATIGKA